MYQIWRVVWNNLHSQSERSIFYDYQLSFFPPHIRGDIVSWYFSEREVPTTFHNNFKSTNTDQWSPQYLMFICLKFPFTWFWGVFFFTSSYLVCFYIPVRPELHCRWLSLPLLRNFVHMNLQSGYRSKRLCNLAWLWFTKDTVYAGSRIRLFTPVT